jgi:hypothetical protein
VQLERQALASLVQVNGSQSGCVAQTNELPSQVTRGRASVVPHIGC